MRQRSVRVLVPGSSDDLVDRLGPLPIKMARPPTVRRCSGSSGHGHMNPQTGHLATRPKRPCASRNRLPHFAEQLGPTRRRIIGEDFYRIEN